MALNFPLNPAAQTPANTYSPTSAPVANTDNNLTYVFDGTKWSTTGSPPFVLKSGDTMSGPLLVPSIDTDSIVTDALSTPNINGGPLAGLRNRIINGDFRLDQRNVGVAQTITAAAALAYTADRFYAYCTGANVSGQRVTVAGTQVDPFRYQFTGAASVTGIGIGQRIEAQSCRDLAGKTVTLSVNLSNSVLTTVNWQAFYANTNDTFGTLASPTRTSIASGSFTVNSTYNRYSTQISIPAAATTGIEIVFSVGAQTSGTWVIGQVQLEEGSVVTPFEQRPIGTENLLSKRYFQWLPFNVFFHSVGAGTSAETPIVYPVEMRIAPTAGAAVVDPNTTAQASNGLSLAIQRITPYSCGTTLTASLANTATYVVGYRFSATAEL